MLPACCSKSCGVCSSAPRRTCAGEGMDAPVALDLLTRARHVLQRFAVGELGEDLVVVVAHPVHRVIERHVQHLPPGQQVVQGHRHQGTPRPRAGRQNRAPARRGSSGRGRAADCARSAPCSGSCPLLSLRLPGLLQAPEQVAHDRLARRARHPHQRDAWVLPHLLDETDAVHGPCPAPRPSRRADPSPPRGRRRRTPPSSTSSSTTRRVSGGGARADAHGLQAQCDAVGPHAHVAASAGAGQGEHLPVERDAASRCAPRSPAPPR